MDKGFQSLDNEDAPARLELQGVSAGYNGTAILQEVSFAVPHGARVAVVGPNGAGKSTLFKVLVGLLPAWQGIVPIHGQPLGHHHDCVAYVPQREEVDWRFPITVEEVVMMGRFGRIGWWKRPKAYDRQVVRRCLEQLGVAHLSRNAIGDLSGGQQQRVFLARALAQEPHILLMDEPFTGVDVTTQEATLNLLDDLHQQGVTAMVSTHDLNLAAQRFEHVLLLNRRLVAFGDPRMVFASENIRAAFGGQMLMVEGGGLVVDQCCGGDDHEHHEHGGGHAH